MSSRNNAIGFLALKRDTNLLASVAPMLNEPALRNALLYYLERQGTNAASVLPLLVEAAVQFVRGDPQFAVQAFQVVERCGRSAPASLISILLPLTFDERFPINSAIPANEPILLCVLAQSALEGVVGNREKLIPVLTESLRHSDWRVRNAAAARLWGMSPLCAETIAALKACLSDTNEVLRLSAAVTLAHHPEFRQPVLDRLLAAIGSSTMPIDLRIHALFQLERRQPTGAEIAHAIPVLEHAQRDPNLKVQQVASRVLANIRPASD